MKLICWLFGHSWKPVRIADWYTEDLNEAYICRRCGKYDEE